MSDITGGTPLPKAVQPVTHGTDKATGVPRDKQQTNTQTREEDGRDQKKPQQQEAVHGRDPAVSISASAAHIHVGEELKQKVVVVDPEGRPIIETETATFALRPDAGLKAGDDVTLIVKDVGKQLAADLLLHNAKVIDPPIRLNLIVIALHTKDTALEPHQPEVRPDTTPGYKPKQNFNAHRVTTTGDTEAATLAQVLGRGAPTSANSIPAPASSETVRNPANLAALISAQQNYTAASSKTGQPPSTAAPLIGQQAASTVDHIIQPSALTEITAPNMAGQHAAGLSGIIPAISLAGKSVNFQLLDPSISKVNPAEVATVTTVRALTAQDAKALPMAAASLGNASALAHVETDKGAFVINQAAATNLAGELVRISSTAQTAPTPDSALPVYSARLKAPHAVTTSSVQVQFPAAANTTATQHNQTSVTAVHIVRAFLTSEGPRSDIRLETPLGDLSLTVPNNIRPATGDMVSILPSPSSDAALAQAATIASSGALSPVSLSHWPSFEQAYDLLQSIAPAGAEALQSLSARTAQGGAKIANSAMFLLSALAGKNASNWLGKSAEAMLAERDPKLLDLLKDDISRLFTIASDTSGDWRALLLPLDAKNQDMPMLAFLFGQGASVDPDRHRKDQTQNQEDNDDLKRFVLEVQFSVLGAVQLDGTIRGNRFDLMIRSAQQFPPALTQDTSELFSNALAAGAFTGSLGFSVEDNFPVNVPAVLEKMSPEQQQQLA